MKSGRVLAALLSGAGLLACGTPTAHLTDGGASTGASTGGSTGATGGGTTSSGGTNGSATTGHTSGGSGGSTGTQGTSSGTGGAVGTTGGIGGSSGSTGNVGSTGGTGASTGASTGGGSTGATSGGSSGGTTGGLLNQPCSVNQGLDPCVAVGLACIFSSDPEHMGTICQLPGEFYPCLASVGCNDSSLDCLSFSTGSYCFRACLQTGDCPTLYTTCQAVGTAMACYYDLCFAGDDGGAFYACDAADAGDGTCIPTTGGAICLQGGSVPAGNACSDHRGPGITEANLCELNGFCIPEGATGAGHCAPLCGLPDGGPGCPSPTFCVPSGSGDWGYCL